MIAANRREKKKQKAKNDESMSDFLFLLFFGKVSLGGKKKILPTKGVGLVVMLLVLVLVWCWLFVSTTCDTHV